VSSDVWVARGSVEHMFGSSGRGEVPGVVAPASEVVAPASGEPSPLVDLVFARMVGVLIAERSATRHAGPRSAGGSPGRSRLGGPDPSGLAHVLDAHAPGADLVALLEGLDPADLSDAAWWRVWLPGSASPPWRRPGRGA